MLEEKIARFRELLATRDEIDQEIAGLLGDTQAPETNWQGEPRQRRPKEARGRVAHKPEKKRAKGEPCAECGSKGTLSYRPDRSTFVPGAPRMFEVN